MTTKQLITFSYVNSWFVIHEVFIYQKACLYRAILHNLFLNCIWIGHDVYWEEISSICLAFPVSQETKSWRLAGVSWNIRTIAWLFHCTKSCVVQKRNSKKATIAALIYKVTINKLLRGYYNLCLSLRLYANSVCEKLWSRMSPTWSTFLLISYRKHTFWHLNSPIKTLW